MMDDFDEPIALTNGFFQALLSGTYPEDIQPVLQIIETRVMPNANIIRMRLSDGLFSYTNCAGNLSINEQLENENFKDSHGIIQVTDFTKSIINGKIGFSIISFKPLQLTNTIIGEPKPHSGEPNDYKGIENFPLAMKPNVNNAQTNAQSPSRKRGFTGQPSTITPSKRQNTMPSGGVFSEGLLDVSMVTPYVSKFRICGAASFKEAPRQINTKRGPSNVFSFILTDVSGNSIKISAFGKECEKFSDIVQDGAAFYVSCVGANLVREANRRYNTTGHTYEITLNNQCNVEPCTDREIGTPTCKLNCIPLIDIKNHPNECVDVLAIVDKVGDISTVKVRATQADLSKRDVTLIDESCTQIQFTLWGDSVDKITSDNIGHVFGIKGASVREFNGGFSLSSGVGTAIIAAPDGDKTTQLFQWYVEVRPNAQVGTLTASEGSGMFEQECRLIQCVNDTNLDIMDRGMFVTLEAFINVVRTENVAYTSCAQENCKKKASFDNNQWSCSVHGVQDSHRYLYMLSLEVGDFSGLTWITLFDEAAAQLFNGMKADQLMDLQTNDRASYDRILQSVRFKTYEFRLRVKNEVYNDQKRARWSCSAVRPVSFTRYAKILQKSIAVLDQE